MNKIALLVITDGRHDYLKQTIASAEANLPGPFTVKILVDDSGDATLPDGELFKNWSHIKHPERRGFVAAINSGWNVARQSGADYLFHLEQDFTFNEPVNLSAMIEVLEANRHLAHITLRRQPVNDIEIAAGTSHAFSVDTHTDGINTWSEYKQFYSTNPALVPRRTFIREFPMSSEVGFGAELLAGGQRFAYWGTPDDQPRVTHIGIHRAEGWKL